MAATDVGKLRVVLAAETDRFNKQLAKSRKANTKLSKSMRGTAKSAKVMSGAMAKLGALAGGALGARAIFNLGKATIALGDDLQKTSRRMGLTVEQLQVLQIEAKAGGFETENLNKAMQKFAVGIGEVATSGTGTLAPTLRTLGIEVRNLSGDVKPLGEIFVEFSQAMGAVQSDQERLAHAAFAFGQRGLKITEVLGLVAQGWDAVHESATRGGKTEVATAAELGALEKLQDALDRLGKAYDTFFLKRFGNLAMLAGFDTPAGTLEREIAAIEELPRFLYQAAHAGGDLVDKVARLRAELKGLQGEIASEAGPAPMSLGDASNLFGSLGGVGFVEDKRRFAEDFERSLERMRIEDWNAGAVDGSLHGWEGEGSFHGGSLEELRASILETETAYTRFADSALNENELIDASLSTVAGGLSNTIASALASGKLDFASFAQSAAASLAQIITQQLIIRSLAAFGFGAADGAVVPGGVETFARGGIVSKPTLFAMGGGGVGLMGEESAEAIMPLRRDKSGRLGVSASGAGTSGAGGIVINVVNNAENSPNNDARMARAIGQQVRAAWNAEARRQMQAGGTLNPIGAGV